MNMGISERDREMVSELLDAGVVDVISGAQRLGLELTVAVARLEGYASRNTEVRKLRDALKSYMAVCGNTAHQVSGITARELYDMAEDALTHKAGE